MSRTIRIKITTVLIGCLSLAAFGQNNVSFDPSSLGNVGKQFDDSVLISESSNGSDESRSDPSGSSPLGNELSLGESDMISVDFPNEEIRTVLRNVADLYMLNIVIPESLQGTISIKLREVSWRQIFNVVLDPIGFTYVEEGNIINVISNDTLNFEPPVTDIFMLNYAEAGQIAGTVTSMVDAEKGGRVQIDARTNGLIVTERQSRMGAIREVVERLDKPTLQVMIETRFVEVTNQDVSKIGVRWNSLDNLEISTDQLSHQFTDIEGRQGMTTTEKDLLLQQSAVRDLSSLVRNGDLTKMTNAVFNSSQIGFIFRALKQQGNSRLVSHPTVVTLNNQEATISIGEQFPIPNYQYNDERGTFEINGFEYKDIGVNLKVKPSVNNQGLITLRVIPEVSSRTGEREFGGASGASIPIISTRRTETQIALQDGYTMGIGGLMQASGVEELSKVPFLSKIPGIGAAFRHKDKEGSKMNLLIFITAKILPSEDADFEDVFSQERMTEVGIDMDAFRNQ